MKKINFKVAVLSMTLFGAYLLPLSVHADFSEEKQSGTPPVTSAAGGPQAITPPTVPVDPAKALQQTAIEAGLAKKDTPNLQGYLGRILGAALALMGIVFLGFTIYGAILWMIARGSSAEVEQAKGTITNSVIGLIIALVAYAITRFVIQLFA